MPIERWNKIKTKDITGLQLDGVEIAVEMRDDSLDSVVITAASGRKLKIAMWGYCMAAYVPSPPKMEQRFVVQGELAGLKVREEFSSMPQAEDRKRDLLNARRQLDPETGDEAFAIVGEEVVVEA